jgi:hypothetical protein
MSWGVKMDNDVRLGTWPELLYRFIEHYKWEPQHLRADDFDARMRRQEVPLNFMLNLLLRCSAPDRINFLLQAFEPGLSNLDDDLELMFPWETKATQPDVRLEGSQSRIFIEVKVDSSIKLDQVQKYTSLHREMDERFGPKNHYLLFLTKRNFEVCWRPKSEAINFVDVHSFVEHQLFGQSGSNVTGAPICSAATWGRFSRQLELLSTSLCATRIVERRIVSDFLHDLGARGLLSREADDASQAMSEPHCG